jgi:hypothetical protein
MGPVPIRESAPVECAGGRRRMGPVPIRESAPVECAGGKDERVPFPFEEWCPAGTRGMRSIPLARRARDYAEYAASSMMSPYWS